MLAQLRCKGAIIVALASISHINGLPKPEVSIAEMASHAWLCERPTSSTSDETESALGTCVPTRLRVYVWLHTATHCRWAFRVKETWLSRTKSYRVVLTFFFLFLPVISTLISHLVCWIYSSKFSINFLAPSHLLVINSLINFRYHQQLNFIPPLLHICSREIQKTMSIRFTLNFFENCHLQSKIITNNTSITFSQIKFSFLFVSMFFCIVIVTWGWH